MPTLKEYIITTIKYLTEKMLDEQTPPHEKEQTKKELNLILTIDKICISRGRY